LFLGCHVIDTPISYPEIKLACVQFAPVLGALDANLASMGRLIRRAHALGASIVVLPELADTGYMFETSEEVAAVATAIPDGQTTQFVCRLANELQIHIVSGLAELDGDHFFNTAILCGPSGYIGKYRKLHLWNRENLFFQKGDLGLPVFATPLGTIGIAICYDSWFPETFRQIALKGGDLVCVPTNWVPMAGHGEKSESMANILHKAAAHSNGLYIACAARIGTERKQFFIGQSVIIGPDGWPLAGPASQDDEEVLIASISLGTLERQRRLNAFNDVLHDRRLDVYG
jgi:predicted amidohydrolase